MRKAELCSIVIGAVLLQWPAAAQTAGESAAWNPIKDSATPEQLKAFLDNFPDGTFAVEARQRYSTAAKMSLAPAMKEFQIVFPNEARRIGRSLGAMRTVKLDILVRPDGTAGDVDIAASSGFDLYDKTAMAAARKASYLPAVSNGMPVEARMAYDVSFGLLCNRAAGNSTCDHGRFPQTCSATVCGLLLR